MALQKKVSKQGLLCNPRLTLDGQEMIRLAITPLCAYFLQNPFTQAPSSRIFIYVEVKVIMSSYCVTLFPASNPCPWEATFSESKAFHLKESCPSDLQAPSVMWRKDWSLRWDGVTDVWLTPCF